MRRVFVYYIYRCQCFVYTRANNSFSSRSTNYAAPWIEQVPEIFIYLRFYWVSEIAWNGKILSNLRLHFTDASSILASFFYHSQCYVYMARMPTKTYDNNFVLLTCTWFEVTANRIAQFFGTSLEPYAKGTGNGKVKKTCQFVTPMKKFHRPKPRCWLTASSHVTIMTTIGKSVDF